MVEPGMERVDRVLKMFPKCKVVAHAYWWRQSQNGACDRQLQEHPNLYADMSGTVVVQVLNRDRKYAREFLIRNQEKILWATDEGWWSFGSQTKQMNQHTPSWRNSIYPPRCATRSTAATPRRFMD